jgi:hypothetical protein
MTTTTETTVDGIAHALASACIDTLREIVAQSTPGAIVAAAEAQARGAGTDTPEAARSALHACLVALEGIRQAIAEPVVHVQLAPASADTEGGEL